ncbi:PEP-CTERM-box response regulator transcription factor [Ferrovum sp.]|uniref:PEP-CTERM-box response regulator transcription factor n=1 Tax=Ferrovum sp. TaxID=2609467 RepID=UPI00261EFB4E|nr:PEP-CTERM-box response regulator transcription factor [Ferrovum sp.]
METLLLVEDDLGLRKQLRWQLEGFSLQMAGCRSEAIACLRRFEPKVVLLDLGLPPDADGVSEGLKTLQELLALMPTTKVIVLTGNTDRENAVQAVALGAYDFCQKPFEPQVLALILERALALHRLEAENSSLKTLQTSTPLQGILTHDPVMQQLCKTVERVASSEVTVLVHGESGTGKELFARATHHLSPRSEQRLVAINCAAIPENLLESELFGYEKGAFTGASKQTIGRIEYAQGGTLFLDEIGDLPLSLQAKLLRFLQERVIERLGGRVEIPVNVRVVCATHQNLTELIRQGRFREDLYYRLSEIVIKVPPLRMRSGDIALLANVFLEKYAASQGRSLRGFKPEAMATLTHYAWPGNVRELENVIKRVSVMAEGPYVGTSDLGLDVPAEDGAMTILPLNLRQVREDAERKAILDAIAQADGNMVQAAGLLGVSRPTLYGLMRQYKLR